ncbi:hypothetical protein F2P79_008472 [Pimephales promelas]|nr:hypothetical protein F2P79_008472 [Pimephales promelas]
MHRLHYSLQLSLQQRTLSYIHPKGSFQSPGPFCTASLPLYMYLPRQHTRRLELQHPTVNAPQTTQAKKKKTHDKSPPAHPTSSYSKVTPPDNNDGLCALQPFLGILQRTNNGAVLRNPTQQNSTEADVEMTARNWLRLRRDRKQEGEHLKVK